MYTIDELARRSGISKRTISYYVKLGLLPQVGTRGISTRYDDHYLDRLALIKILQANHLPLEEISELLSKLSTNQIAKLAAASEDELRVFLAMEDPQKVLKSSKEVMLAEDASEYIRKVMDLSMTTASKRLQPARKLPLPPAKSSSSSWMRIEVVDGVELHVDNARVSAFHDKVNQLVAYARNLFAK